MTELSSLKEEVEKIEGPKARYIKVVSKTKEKKLNKGVSPDDRDNLMMACYAHKHFDIEPIEQQTRYNSRARSGDDYYFSSATC